MTVSELYDKFKIYIDKKLDTIKPQLEALFTNYKVADVGSNINDVKKVADDILNVNTVSSNINDITTTSTNISDIKTSATNINDIKTTSQNITDIKTVSTNIANVNAAGASISNVNTVAGSIDNINTVSTNINNINAVGTNIDNVNTTASKITDIETFAKVYQGAFNTPPATRNDGSDLLDGDLYFDTTNKMMMVYSTADGWKGAGSSVNGIIKRQTFTGDGTTTSFTVTGGYDGGYAQVFVNGILMENGVDVDVSSGSIIDFTNAPADGDVIEFIGFGSFTLADHYTKTEVDTNFAKVDLLNVNDIDILNKLKNVDGEDSGLDADLLRGLPADFTASLASAGYQKLPSGLIIQWGDGGPIGANSGIDITFPISFPNEALSISATISITGADGNDTGPAIKGLTVTGVRIINTLGNTDIDHTFYIAIGY